VTDHAVRIKGLGKRFVKSDGSRSLLRQMFGRSEIDHFWALKDVNIDIRKGESFGLIGPNGAGKSTLLKIISRIFLPTEGEIELYGRVNSLLEVGTGFESELTGRKNVYLNGSILGMSPREIDSVYDEIVEFAGLGDFMDMPVKHYSSGMYARLAFSVAAYVTGDILAIDEVLSVGDAEFRRKSMGRMEDMISGGSRTIIFVSHSTDAITRLCDRAAWIHKGRIREIGAADEVVRSYLSASTKQRSLHVVGSAAPAKAASGAALPAASAPAAPDPASHDSAAVTYAHRDDPEPDAAARIERAALVDENGVPRDVVFRDQPQTVEIGFSVLKGSAPPMSCYIGLGCGPRKGVAQETSVLSSYTESRKFAPGRYVARLVIPANLLTSAEYYVLVGLKTISKPIISHDTVKRAIQFRVIDRNAENEVGAELMRGVIHPELVWDIESAVSLETSKAI
jgi:ABC-type polysaccharide/polyol phosphate transport system ATPase subunit